MILASIVEKETGRADERPRIAAVFENRLRKNMRLQSDPTIIYGLVGGKGVLDHPIQQDELERDTPYNTYKINGLPPTPIANPGRAAIEAVLKPAKTKDLYFVADGTGGHSFAPSLEEHNRNVVKWRQVERAMREKEREEAAAAAAAAAGAGGRGRDGDRARAGRRGCNRRALARWAPQPPDLGRHHAGAGSTRRCGSATRAGALSRNRHSLAAPESKALTWPSSRPSAIPPPVNVTGQRVDRGAVLASHPAQLGL